MSPPGNMELWIISILLLFTVSGLVTGYSPCYTQATANSIPVALLCYNNHISGRGVVIDGYRAKDSKTSKCQCRVSGDKTRKMNFTNYNGNNPGNGCGSSIMVQFDGTSFLMNCYVSDNQISTNGMDVKVNLDDPQIALNTNYCISIESVDSSAMLNVSCDGDALPSTTTTQFSPTTEQEETSSSSLTTGDQITTSTSKSSPPTTGNQVTTSTSQSSPPTTEDQITTSTIQSISPTTGNQITTSTSQSSPITTEQVTSTPSLSTTAQTLSTSTQSSVTTKVSTSSISTVPQTFPSSSQTAITSTEALLTTEDTSTEKVSGSSSSQAATISTDILFTQTTSVTATTSGQTTEKGTATDEMTTDNGVTTEVKTESTTRNDVTESPTAPSQTSEHVSTKTLPSTTTGRISTETMTSTSSATLAPTTGGVKNTTGSALPVTLVSTSTEQNTVAPVFTTKKTTPVVPVSTTNKPLPERGTPWSGIIPAILLGIILFVVLVFAFIKWQRSREIKYPEDNGSISIDKYPAMGETNFGYDAYDEGPEIITEFTKSPEDIEIDGIALTNTATYDVEPRDITKGPFVRYNVKDYRASGNNPEYAVVNRRKQTGPDIYF